MRQKYKQRNRKIVCQEYILKKKKKCQETKLKPN